MMPAGVRYAPLGFFLSVFLSLAPQISPSVAAQTAGVATERATKRENLEIPTGIILPVRLNQGLSSKSAQPGQIVTARVMQEVPLLNNGKIPEGAKVFGTIVSVERAGKTTNAKIALRFDTLEINHRRIPVLASLRALAGFMEVQSAQTPEFSPGFGTPYIWATTRQIGGDEVYGVGGPVTNQVSETVGKGVYGGGLVYVRAPPGIPRRGGPQILDCLQGLVGFFFRACWVFRNPGGENRSA